MATKTRAPSENKPYQGYPFVNPVVTDVPTLDPAAAAKWAHLPRRPIGTPVRKNDNNFPSNNNNTVYIDIPKEAGSSTNVQTGSSSRPQGLKGGRDVPEIYIDVPEQTETNDSTTSRNSNGQENPAFIEETIFFDPFENRQIDVNKSSEGANRPGTTGSPSSGPGAGGRPTRPAPPVNLNLPTPGSSGSSSSQVPGFLSKESQVYGGSDGFSLSPLAEREFPEPPPAYSELPTTTTGSTANTQSIADPPRTVVVGPDTSATVGLASSNRKLVLCRSCGLRVHTVVVPENGAFTHFLAFITILLCILPVTVVIYCTDFFKYRVHFCPNCNHSVGHEVPALCQDMVYH